MSPRKVPLDQRYHEVTGSRRRRSAVAHRGPAAGLDSFDSLVTRRAPSRRRTLRMRLARSMSFTDGGRRSGLLAATPPWVVDPQWTAIPSTPAWPNRRCVCAGGGAGAARHRGSLRGLVAVLASWHLHDRSAGEVSVRQSRLVPDGRPLTRAGPRRGLAAGSRWVRAMARASRAWAVLLDRTGAVVFAGAMTGEELTRR